MSRLSRVTLVVCAGWLVACGGAPPPATPEPARAPVAAAVEPAAVAAEPSVESSVAPAAAAAATTRDVPGACEDKQNCYPPAAFVEAVCKKRFPDLPLYLFAGRMPWQHMYVKAEWVEPVNAHGGEQSEAWMKFGEEVVVLRKRGPGGGKGVQISGPSDVDVLRWDGTCATIRQEMLVTYVPAPMQSPLIVWKYLNSDLQEALLKSSVVAQARESERKRCRDSSLKHPTESCGKAMRQLTDAIALAVHQNVALPGTGTVPEWAK
ncbi:MAG TPA: hypothetical protein VEX18_14245 [Polyangiaceae bacterium]|nr:hypothetical protein [Polyangiaceae bacterium]